MGIEAKKKKTLLKGERGWAKYYDHIVLFLKGIHFELKNANSVSPLKHRFQTVIIKYHTSFENTSTSY